MSKQRKDQQGQNQSRPGEPDTHEGGREAPRAGNQQHQNLPQRPQQGSHSQSPGQPGSAQPGSQQRSGQQHQEDHSRRQYGSHEPQRPDQQHERSANRGPQDQNRDKP